MTQEGGVKAQVDPRPRQLLERYAELTGGVLTDIGDLLVALTLTPKDRQLFSGRESLEIALAPSALDERPNADILVNGSSLLQQLIDAIRERGTLDDRGALRPEFDVASDPPAPEIRFEGQLDAPPRITRTWIPAGQLLVRVNIRAGPSLVERLVESAVANLSTGSALSSEVARRCDHTATHISPSEAGLGELAVADLLPMKNLLVSFFADLERQLAGELSRIQADAAGALTAEVARLDSYYKRMGAEVDPDDDASAARERRKAIESDRERRLSDERHRFTVRIDVHPVQLTRWLIPAERATWTLVSGSGHTAPVAASRLLVGSPAWVIACPACGLSPELLRVCTHGHAACADCSGVCGVCRAAKCTQHGLKECAIDLHPVCDEHAAECPSCNATHCTNHSARCAAADHDVCSRCIVSCAICARALCKPHASRTTASAPNGVRWLCSTCSVTCEGGAAEIVGRDEVDRCSSCERHICHAHRAVCAVDGKPHCSSHLRRTDRSGRLACEQHRGTCAEERESVYTTDELEPCATCAQSVCGDHRGTCSVDGQSHCHSHLMKLSDLRGQFGCSLHVEICDTDSLAFSIGGTISCPVCQKRACKSHQKPCANCGRTVCARHSTDGTCLTCRKLAEDSEPSDEVLAALAEATAADAPGARGWRLAIDGTHTVVEVPLGWRRRLVMTLRHGDSIAESLMQHGLLTKKRLR